MATNEDVIGKGTNAEINQSTSSQMAGSCRKNTIRQTSKGSFQLEP